MDAGIEKECSALGGLFQLIMNDMKVKNLNKLTFIVTLNHLSLFLSRYLLLLHLQCIFTIHFLSILHVSLFFFSFCVELLYSPLLCLFFSQCDYSESHIIYILCDVQAAVFRLKTKHSK